MNENSNQRVGAVPCARVPLYSPVQGVTRHGSTPGPVLISPQKSTLQCTAFPKGVDALRLIKSHEGLLRLVFEEIGGIWNEADCNRHSCPFCGVSASFSIFKRDGVLWWRSDCHLSGTIVDLVMRSKGLGDGCVTLYAALFK